MIQRCCITSCMHYNYGWCKYFIQESITEACERYILKKKHEQAKTLK